MKTLSKIIILLLAISFQLSAISCFADIPHLINYQGKLTDKDNKPIEGTHAITFRIYDAETSGTLLWEETQSVTIQKGIFSVMLGGVTALNLAFDKPYWLEIKVGTEAMSPRQQIASVPYAFTAEYGVPRGTIVMWSGSIANIPKGWALCDGTNGTPDLRDKFIVGAKQDDGGIAKTNISGSLLQSGGSTQISIDNLPPHDHGLAGEHTHDMNLGSSGYGISQDNSRKYGSASGYILPAGNHTHQSVGKGMPYTQPYYALTYIMKI